LSRYRLACSASLRQVVIVTNPFPARWPGS
jgi:hypothetical protein